MAQEGQLWDIALQHLGHDELLELVVELWRGASPPCAVEPEGNHEGSKRQEARQVR